MIDRVGIFIDGGYLDQILKHTFNRIRIDFEKLIRHLGRDERVLRVYYYHCPPYKDDPPSREQNERFARAESFYAQLERIPKFEVRKGKLAKRETPDGSPYYVQKGIDVLLATDLVLLSAKQSISRAVVLAGDSDYLPAIQIAKNEGVHITLVHGPDGTYHKHDLWQHADERIALTEEIVQSMRRSDKLDTSH